MKLLIKSILLITLIIFTVSSLQAQDYRNAASIKMGNMVQLTYKVFVSEDLAFEVSAGKYLINYPGNFLNLTTQYHIDSKFEGLRFYYGAGIGVRLFSFMNQFGPAGAFGMEATMPDFPINFSLSFHPVLFLENKSNGFGSPSNWEAYLTGPVTLGARLLF